MSLIYIATTARFCDNANILRLPQ